MSQDIEDTANLHRVRGVFLWPAWWAAGGLVVAVGVEDEFAEELAGGGVDDADVQVLDEHHPGRKRGIGTSDPGMIGYTLAEIRRLLIKITQQRPPDPEHAWSWSRWRRKRQYQARICHYQRRGYALT